nr:Ig-like domain-containing protein [Lachnospiraceae bacterium]
MNLKKRTSQLLSILLAALLTVSTPLNAVIVRAEVPQDISIDEEVYDTGTEIDIEEEDILSGTGEDAGEIPVVDDIGGTGYSDGDEIELDIDDEDPERLGATLFTVTFHYPDPEDDIVKNVREGAKVKKPAADPEMDGMDFNYWTEEEAPYEAAPDEFDFNMAIAGNTDLFPYFTEVSVIIVNDGSLEFDGVTDNKVSVVYGNTVTEAASYTGDGDPEIVYESGNEAIAEVDENGEVTTKSAGVTAITAKAYIDNEVIATASYALTVTRRPLRITADSDEFTYDGNNHSCHDYVIVPDPEGGLAGDEEDGDYISWVGFSGVRKTA